MKNFTKSDLQNGMVVETREDRYMVVGDEDYAFGLTIDSAKEMIKSLQEIYGGEII